MGWLETGEPVELKLTHSGCVGNLHQRGSAVPGPEGKAERGARFTWRRRTARSTSDGGSRAHDQQGCNYLESSPVLLSVALAVMIWISHLGGQLHDCCGACYVVSVLVAL